MIDATQSVRIDAVCRLFSCRSAWEWKANLARAIHVAEVKPNDARCFYMSCIDWSLLVKKGEKEADTWRPLSGRSNRAKYIQWIGNALWRHAGPLCSDPFMWTCMRCMSSVGNV